MSKKNLLIIVVIIIVLIGIGWLKYYQQAKSIVTSNQAIQLDQVKISTDESKLVHSESSTDSSSQILEYTPEVLSQTIDTKRVLFFFANWCPTCKAAEADLRANIDSLPNDLKIIKVNYNDSQTDDDEKALAQKYGITYQHTFVLVDEEMNAVEIWNGGQTKELLQKISQR